MAELMNQDLIKSLFVYSDGILLWRERPSKKIAPGSIAGSKDKDGYVVVFYKGKHYKAHHLVYAMHTGIYPKYIDHIDRNRSNNRIENLREITHSENMQNKNAYSSNVSKTKYVYWYKQTNKWQVKINTKHVGYFYSLNEAQSALTKYMGENS